ncbi:hypothetical protein ACWC91_40975 [Streptomyces sp. NPDC001204]
MTTLLVFDAIDTAGTMLDALGIWILVGAAIFTAALAVLVVGVAGAVRGLAALLHLGREA